MHIIATFQNILYFCGWNYTLLCFVQLCVSVQLCSKCHRPPAFRLYDKFIGKSQLKWCTRWVVKSHSFIWMKAHSMSLSQCWFDLSLSSKRPSLVIANIQNSILANNILVQCDAVPLLAIRWQMIAICIAVPWGKVIYNFIEYIYSFLQSQSAQYIILKHVTKVCLRTGVKLNLIKEYFSFDWNMQYMWIYLCFTVF